MRFNFLYSKLDFKDFQRIGNISDNHAKMLLHVIEFKKLVELLALIPFQLGELLIFPMRIDLANLKLN